MSSTARSYALLALILVLSLSLRLAAGVWWQSRLADDQSFGFGDSESYWQLGRTISRGEPYQYGSPDARVFRTPGYPLILATLFRVSGGEPPVFWARVTSAIFATLAVGGVYCLGRQLFNTTTALIAALLSACYPGSIAIGALILAEAPFCLFMLLEILLWIRGTETERPRRAALCLLSAGLAAGAATLIRPSWLLWTPLAAILGILFTSNRKRHALASLLVMVGLCLAMTPWWIRNARVVGRFVPTTLQVGASLYDGLNPEATGASNMDFVSKFVDKVHKDEQAKPSPAPDGGMAPLEVRLDRNLRQAALAWARDHPGEVFRLTGVKLIRLWNVWPNEPRFQSLLLRTAILVSFVPIMVLAVIAGWRYRKRGWPIVLCVLPAVYFTMLHVVFVSSIRYRQPAMLPLMVLAAAVIADKLARSRTPQVQQTPA